MCDDAGKGCPVYMRFDLLVDFARLRRLIERTEIYLGIMKIDVNSPAAMVPVGEPVNMLKSVGASFGRFQYTIKKIAGWGYLLVHNALPDMGKA